MSARHSKIAAMLRETFQFTRAPDVVEWLEANIVLPRSMSPARPGPYRCARQPTSRPILQCFHPASGARMIANVAGAQTAKTTEGVLGMAYRFPHSPMPTLIMGPSESWLKLEISEKRLMALINENPVLAKLKPLDRDKFRTMAMAMVGGTIAIEGANSPVATAGSTQGIVWVEEAAKIEHHSSEQTPEAHPIKLAFERTKAFRGQELHYLSFTPNHSANIAWQYYLRGDQTHFYVQCPHCNGDPFPFEFELRKEGELEANLEESQHEARPQHYRSLIWSPEARAADGSWSETKIRETAVYVCPRNGCEIDERHRLAMIAAFQTKAHNAGAAKSDRSFRRPSFYSPTVTFADMALEFLRRGDLLSTGLQNFYNSWLALPWEKVSMDLKDDDVRQLRDLSDYRSSIIPREPLFVGLWADPGETRTHWVVGAVYEDERIDIIDCGTVTSIDDLLELPGQLRYQVAGTSTILSPSRGLCDSGHETFRVYDMCVRSRGFWSPTKGSDANRGTWGITALRSHPLDLYVFNDFAFKKELYRNRIKRRMAPRLGIPRDASESLIQGLSGQKIIIQNGRESFPRVPGDHFGDCTKQGLLHAKIWLFSLGRTAPDLSPMESHTVSQV